MRPGAALIVSMIFVLVFSALAVSLATVSGTNVQLANNQHKANLAFCAAQSGLEVLRYWLAKEPNNISGETVVERMQDFKLLLQGKFDGLSNIAAVYKPSDNTVIIPAVTLDAKTGQNFGAVFSLVEPNEPNGPNKLRAMITGVCVDAKNQTIASKLVIVDYNVVPDPLPPKSVFNYGVATKGTMSMVGQAMIDDVNITVKSGVYIEGDGAAGDAFSSANNTKVAGDVEIANQYATVSVGGSVGGVQGGEGHVKIGVPYVDFPTPNPKHFLQYATGPEITSSHNNNSTVLNNAIIKAGSNVTFSKDITINGVLYIEQPSTVHFSGKATVNAIIAGDGIENGHNGTSSLKFSGQVISNDVSTLPDSYGAIKQETGTFICAPGFMLEFTGQNLNLGGAIAGNGIKFSGQAGGEIKNSIINYSTDADSMEMVGQGTLTFNRSEKPAAGLELNPHPPNANLVFMPSSYSESL